MASPQSELPRPPLDLRLSDASLSRRRFLLIVGTSLAGPTISSLATACSSSGTGPPTATKTGLLDGTVVDALGAAQSVGRIYLLLKSGLNTGRYVDVDAQGRFTFGNVAIGDYQVRYWAGSQYHVPEPNLNPIRVTVTTATVATARFVIEPASPSANVREIYAGDDFFQEQPFGDPNAAVVVKLGTTVCWYNVGSHTHSVTGGPWIDSGTIHEADEFMWVADRIGTFGYRCTFHDPEMRSTLQVVP